MRTGVIGLGAMGSGMALNLYESGDLTCVWNRTASKAMELARRTGVDVADSITSLALRSELIVICVARDEDVLQVVHEIAKGGVSGTVVVDTSTVSSETARQASNALSAVGIDFLDCPVSGGVEGARQGSLSMMVGGRQAT